MQICSTPFGLVSEALAVKGFKVIPIPSDYEDIVESESTSWYKIEYKADTNPDLYIKFAIKDFEEEKTGRAFINALSNAKRALHLQVETLANAFGFESFNLKKRPNFHDYLEYCKKCSILTPRILKDLNGIRNTVEHEYYMPDESETEDFIDVVALFLEATDKFVYHFPSSCEFTYGGKVCEEAPDISYVELSAYTGELTLVVFPDKKFESIEEWETYKYGSSIRLSPNEKEFYMWLEYLIDMVHRS